MDFIRRSLLPYEGTGDTFPNRCRGADAALPLFRFHCPPANRITMTTRGNTEVELTGDAPIDDSQLATAQLHAALRDVPLPAGFMHRLRQFVQHGLEAVD